MHCPSQRDTGRSLGCLLRWFPWNHAVLVRRARSPAPQARRHRLTSKIRRCISYIVLIKAVVSMSKATDPPITSESSDNRTPLPALGQAECTSNKHAGLWPRVADALLPKWPHELEGERWFSTDDAYVDQEFDLEALPFWLRDTSVGWVRAPSLSSQSAQSASSEILVKTSIISNEEFVTDDQSNVRSAQAVENTALAEWSETAIDAITNEPLPQVVVLPPQTDRGTPPPRIRCHLRGFCFGGPTKWDQRIIPKSKMRLEHRCFGWWQCMHVSAIKIGINLFFGRPYTLKI